MIKSRLCILGPASSVHLEKWVAPFVNDYEVKVISFHKPRDFFVSETNTSFLNCHGFKVLYIFFIPFVWLTIRRFKPDIVHAHYLSSYGVVGSLTCWNAPLYVSVWGSDFLMRSRLSLFRFFFKWVFRRCKRLNVPAEYMKKILVSLFDELPQIDVFQYGICLENYTCLKNTGNEIKQIVSTRGYADIYRNKALIDAFVCSDELGAIARLDIYGSCFDDFESGYDDDFLKGKGVFLHGVVSEDEVAAILSQADIYVSIPSSDGTPLSVLEAMASGCVPVVSDIEANRELFSDDGAFFVSNDLDNVEQKVIEAIHGSPEAIIEENYRKVSDTCSYEINIYRLRAVYQEMIGR